MSTFAEKSSEANAIKRQIRLEEAMAANEDTCRECHKRVFWAKTPKGKSLLFDPETSPKGSWLISPVFGNKLVARFLNEHDKRFYPNAGLHICHLDSCEKRERHTVAERANAERLRSAS